MTPAGEAGFHTGSRFPSLVWGGGKDLPIASQSVARSRDALETPKPGFSGKPGFFCACS
jgi:hypothetical protein